MINMLHRVSIVVLSILIVVQLDLFSIALVHKEMQSCYQISQIRIDADIVIKS